MLLFSSITSVHFPIHPLCFCLSPLPFSAFFPHSIKKYFYDKSSSSISILLWFLYPSFVSENGLENWEMEIHIIFMNVMIMLLGQRTLFLKWRIKVLEMLSAIYLFQKGGCLEMMFHILVLIGWSKKVEARKISFKVNWQVHDFYWHPSFFTTPHSYCDKKFILNIFPWKIIRSMKLEWNRL